MKKLHGISQTIPDGMKENTKKKNIQDLHQHQPYPLYMTVDARNQNFLKIRVDAVPTKKLNHS